MVIEINASRPGSMDWRWVNKPSKKHAAFHPIPMRIPRIKFTNIRYGFGGQKVTASKNLTPSAGKNWNSSSRTGKPKGA